jgi:hypothetical protein
MNERSIELVVSAHRARGGSGALGASDAWHDLTPAERVEAERAATLMRTLETALDPEGLSTTARAVLAAIAR